MPFAGSSSSSSSSLSGESGIPSSPRGAGGGIKFPAGGVRGEPRRGGVAQRGRQLRLRAVPGRAARGSHMAAPAPAAASTRSAAWRRVRPRLGGCGERGGGGARVPRAVVGKRGEHARQVDVLKRDVRLRLGHRAAPSRGEATRRVCVRESVSVRLSALQKRTRLEPVLHCLVLSAASAGTSAAARRARRGPRAAARPRWRPARALGGVPEPLAERRTKHPASNARRARAPSPRQVTASAVARSASARGETHAWHSASAAAAPGALRRGTPLRRRARPRRRARGPRRAFGHLRDARARARGRRLVSLKRRLAVLLDEGGRAAFFGAPVAAATPPSRTKAARTTANARAASACVAASAAASSMAPAIGVGEPRDARGGGERRMCRRPETGAARARRWRARRGTASRRRASWSPRAPSSAKESPLSASDPELVSHINSKRTA